MLKKRLIGVVTVKDGWAVQSFGYRRYLPLGKPEVLVENLDRWGVDEILLQSIDRSIHCLGPDLEVLRKVGKLSITTPLIYAGGINCRDDAVKVVSSGADRIMVGSMLFDSPGTLEEIARDLGTQAIIGHVSIRADGGVLKALDYRNKLELQLNDWLAHWPMEWLSEVMVTDWIHDGYPDSFDEHLLAIAAMIHKPLLCFGGISQPPQLQRLLAHPQVVAAGVGNFLSYREHAVQKLKKALGNHSIRLPYYESTNWDQ